MSTIVNSKKQHILRQPYCDEHLAIQMTDDVSHSLARLVEDTRAHTHTYIYIYYINIYIYIHVYIYIYQCQDISINRYVFFFSYIELVNAHEDTHTYTHTYIYIYAPSSGGTHVCGAETLRTSLFGRQRCFTSRTMLRCVMDGGKKNLPGVRVAAAHAVEHVA